VSATVTEKHTCPIPAIPGRWCDFEGFRGSASALRSLDGRTFDTPENFARFVGQHYGWRSDASTHVGPGLDGIAWRIIDTMSMVYKDTRGIDGGPHSYFVLVPSLETMTNGYHADLVGLAFESAGLVVLPVEVLP
jgi:hypothetical protein